MKPAETPLWAKEREPKDEGVAPTKTTWKYLMHWADDRAKANSYPASFPGLGGKST